MSEKFIHEVLLPDAGHRVLVVQTHQTVGLLDLRALHLHAAGVIGRGRTELNLAHTAIGHLNARPPLRRRSARRIHNGRQGGVAVTVDAAVALHLHLPLNATQLLRHRSQLVEALVVLTQLGNDKGIVVVPIEQFVLRVLRLLGGSVVVIVEDGAVDALGLVFLGNQPLIAVDDLVQLSRLFLSNAGVGGVGPGIVHIHGSHLHLNDLLRPLRIPALSRHLVLDLLRGH